MGTNEGPPDFDATRAELFEAISHPARIKILQALSEKPMGFAQLGRAVGIESGGHLSFHLNKLRHLIKVAPDGNYVLTADGKEALWSVNALRRASNERATRTEGPTLQHRSWLKPTIGVILVVILILGGFGAYQQGEFAAQQAQIGSQQRQITSLEGNLPFVDGQNASLVIGQENFTGHSAGTSASSLRNPGTVRFDSSGDMWVFDAGNNRVLKFKPPFTDGMKASLVIGQKDYVSNQPATSQNGFGVITGCCGPSNGAFDSSGDLWVVDFLNNRILEFRPPFTTGMNASLVIGQRDFTHNSGICDGSLDCGPSSANRLNSPTQAAFDSYGNLWVLDGGDNRVLEFNPPSNSAMNASLVIGQTNFHDTHPSSAPGGLNASFGDLAIDPVGDLWVGDARANQLLEFEPPFLTGMKASYEISQQNLVLNTSQGCYATFQCPRGSPILGWAISFDPAGNLWASSNNMLLAFKAPFIPGARIFPSVEIGQPNLTSSILSGGPGGLSGPNGLAFDLSGNLWVADGDNNRILEFAAGSSPRSSAQSWLPILTNPELELAAVGSATIVVGVVVALELARRRKYRRSCGGSASQ